MSGEAPEPREAQSLSEPTTAVPPPPGGTTAPTAERLPRVPILSTDSIWDRIKRDKVVEWTVAYGAFGYALLNGVQMLRETFGWPLLVPRLTVIVLLVGVPVAVTLAWYQGHRAQRRISGIELSILIALLLLSGSVLWWASRTGSTHVASAVVADATHSNTPLGDKSIAVLPFTDMSEKKDQEYFGDGMSEEILDMLAKIPGLTVIGRTSSFQFKGKNADLRTIGTQLNAAHVLEGSVRNSGDQVRITAQLINTRTGAHEWSETYDRQIGDVLKLQDAIATAVARELQLIVDPGYLASRTTLKSAEAYDLILRGRHAADRFDKEGLEEAVTLYQQAINLDASSAQSIAELAYAYYNQGAYGFTAGNVAFEQARRAAEAALKMDPKIALAHEVLGDVNMVYDWDWAAAEREHQRAATLAPGNAGALNGEAWLFLALGRWEDAFRKIKAALAQDPLDPNGFENLAWVQMHRGHLSDAESAMRRGLDIRPTYGWGRLTLGLVLLERGDRDAALLAVQQETTDEGRQAGLAMVNFALGRIQESDAALARMLKEQATENAFEIANVYAYRGQSDEAMNWLERAHTQKDINLFLVKAYPTLKNLSGDSRYKAFLHKMNLPE